MLWKQNRDISKHAVCLTCEAKPKVEVIKCVRCKKDKLRKDYDDLLLQRWAKHRELKKKAECKTCAAARGVKTHEPKRVWKQTAYTCSQCEASYPSSYFDYTKLATFEDEDQVYLAVCLPCERTDTTGPPVQCVGCKKQKNRNEFSFARQRSKGYSTWRCLECDFPPCQICTAKPDIPKMAPYICDPCSFPPCRCGAPRPRSSKYRSSNKNMKNWTCSECREM